MSTHRNNPITIEAAGDQVWEDLNHLYLECRATSSTPIQVLPLLKDKEKISAVPNPRLLVDQARVLSKDIEHYNNVLETIHKKHAMRNGDSLHPDELMEALSIGEEYQTWLSDFQSVVMPTVEEILEQFAQIKDQTPSSENQ